MRRLLLLSFAAMAGLAAAPARAAEPDERRAEALFREGREALARGDEATACAKFAESVKSARRSGPLFNVAKCEAQRGDLVGALSRWREGLALLPAGDERAGPAREQISALERRVPTITLQVDPAAAAAASVALDGAPFDRAYLGVARPLNPGEHEIVVTIPGRPAWRLSVKLVEGERRELLASAAPLAPVAEEKGGARRTAGFVVGGVGIASLVVGAVTGGLALGKKSAEVDACKGGCTQAARDAAAQGKALGNASTATFVIGGAALVAGVVLVVTDRKPATPAPITAVSFGASPLPGGGAVALRGAFP